NAVRRARSGRARGAADLTCGQGRASPAARRKAARKRTEPADGGPLPVHSFHTLLGDLAPLPAMSSASGAITSPRFSPPPPAHSIAPSICLASSPPRRQTDTATASYINALRPKEGKVRSNRLAG